MLTVGLENREKSALKIFTEKPILHNFQNVCPIPCPRLCTRPVCLWGCAYLRKYRKKFNRCTKGMEKGTENVIFKMVKSEDYCIQQDHAQSD